MTDKVDAEYSAHWQCPKCENQTSDIDDDHIVSDRGTELKIRCVHDVDVGKDDFVPCGHEYTVNLNP